MFTECMLINFKSWDKSTLKTENIFSTGTALKHTIQCFTLSVLLNLSFKDCRNL